MTRHTTDIIMTDILYCDINTRDNNTRGIIVKSIKDILFILYYCLYV